MSSTVHVALTEDDVAALSDYYYRHSPRGRRRDRLLKGIPLMVALAWAVAARSDPAWGGGEPLYLITGVPIIAGLGWLSVWYLRPQIARWSVRMGPRRRMLEPLTLRLTPQALQLVTPQGVGKAPWSGVSHVGHTAEHCFLLFAGPNGFVAPRRCFESEEDYLAFCNQAESLVAKAAKSQ